MSERLEHAAVQCSNVGAIFLFTAGMTVLGMGVPFSVLDVMSGVPGGICIVLGILMTALSIAVCIFISKARKRQAQESINQGTIITGLTPSQLQSTQPYNSDTAQSIPLRGNATSADQSGLPPSYNEAVYGPTKYS